MRIAGHDTNNRGSERSMRGQSLAQQEVSRLDGAVAGYARALLANRTAFQELNTVLERFHEHGIECLLLKGADLIPRLYGILGARPMADVDLLVHEADLPGIDRKIGRASCRERV